MNKLAYVDNNVIVDFEQNKITRNDLLLNIDQSISAIYYSSAHLQEANEMNQSNKEKFSEWLTERFSSISNLTHNKYFYLDNASNLVHKYVISPENVYETINQIQGGPNIIKSLIGLISEKDKISFRDLLQIDMKRINNYSPEEVIEHITIKMKNFSGYSFSDLIELGINKHPSGQTFGLHNRIAGVFEFLDMVGYWKDQFNKKSNYARLWDSYHTFFSAYCGYFISNDKRTCKKAKVAFELYGIKTEVVNTKGERF